MRGSKIRVGDTVRHAEYGTAEVVNLVIDLDQDTSVNDVAQIKGPLADYEQVPLSSLTLANADAAKEG